MNQTPVITIENLDQWLNRTPLLADLHPLIPLCLKSDVSIVDKADEIIEAFDNPHRLVSGRFLITSRHAALEKRFPKVVLQQHPPISEINRNLHNQLSYARTHLLTNHGVAKYLAEDVARHRYQVVVLLLIDGLSYGDVLSWNRQVAPCFVDGPSVTYRFDENDRSNLLPTIGFAAIINNPSIFSRLYRIGYRHARGYTYWRPNSNIIADHMFSGIPYERATNFDSILQHVGDQQFPDYSYLQIVREGLDGLAHGKRELRRVEIDGSILAVKHDIDALVQVLRSKGKSACVYITADHGVLWKSEHSWQVLDVKGSKPRFMSDWPSPEVQDFMISMNRSGQEYHMFKYPYLGSPIRVNDCGVHGGLSYQESIVPFMKIEVA